MILRFGHTPSIQVQASRLRSHWGILPRWRFPFVREAESGGFYIAEVNHRPSLRCWHCGDQIPPNCRHVAARQIGGPPRCVVSIDYGSQEIVPGYFGRSPIVEDYEAWERDPDFWKFTAGDVE